MAGPAVFVGRDNELSQLLAALGGESRLALVAGDAGVGKTRFVTEAMTRAAATGMVMVRGECLPLASTLTLLPVADALGGLARLEGGGRGGDPAGPAVAGRRGRAGGRADRWARAAAGRGRFVCPGRG